MESVEARLRLLRTWFVVGFLIQWIIGTVVSIRVLGSLQNSLFLGRALYARSPELVVISSLAVGALLFALGLLVFHSLLRHQNWARCLLLIVAWLSVAGAILSLLSTPLLGMMREQIGVLLPGNDWGQLAAMGLWTNLMKAVFWGYMIIVLQFDRAVRATFLPTLGPA